LTSAFHSLHSPSFIQTFKTSPPLTRGAQRRWRCLGFDLSDNTRGQASGRDESWRTINIQRTVKTLELLRFQNRQQGGIKSRFRFETVLRKTAVSVPISITVTRLVACSQLTFKKQTHEIPFWLSFCAFQLAGVLVKMCVIFYELHFVSFMSRT